MNCVHILHAGYCTAPEHIAIQGGAWRHIHFPAMFALIEHPRFGPMLFDTGYSYRFFEETRKFPNRFYRWMTPVTLCEKDLATNQLSTLNISKDPVFIECGQAHGCDAVPQVLPGMGRDSQIVIGQAAHTPALGIQGGCALP